MEDGKRPSIGLMTWGFFARKRRKNSFPLSEHEEMREQTGSSVEDILSYEHVRGMFLHDERKESKDKEKKKRNSGPPKERNKEASRRAVNCNLTPRMPKDAARDRNREIDCRS